MEAIVFGASGMLGTDVADRLRAEGHDVIPVGRTELDLSRPDSITTKSIQNLGPRASWLINCAAYTAVDDAEAEPELAIRVNGVSPGRMASVCRELGVRMLQVSTDYVFDGEKLDPYVETDPAIPLGVYGKTKLLGEEQVLRSHAEAVVVRTSWLYGPNGKSFPRSIIRAWLEGRPIRAAVDQVGTPTYTGALARLLNGVIAAGLPGGIYHAAGRDILTRHAWARLALEAFREVHGIQRNLDVGEAAAADFPLPARRPAYCALSSSKLLALGIPAMPPALDSLRDFCFRLGPSP